MERRHSSFLLRCWWRGEELERIEIEHIQSGRRERAGSVEDAVERICSQDSDSSGRGKEGDDDGNTTQIID